MRRAEVLQHRQAFAEVGLDRRLDDLARRLGHQAAHAGELADLLDAAAGAGVGHQEDRVEVDLAVADVVAGARSIISRGDLLAGVRPGVEHLVVALLLGDDAALVAACWILSTSFSASSRIVRPWSSGVLQVVGGERQARSGSTRGSRVSFMSVEQVDRLAAAEDLVAVGDDAAAAACWPSGRL